MTVPAGEFWTGEGKSLHRVNVAAFQIARTPITNAQYALFVADANVKPPDGWRGGQPPQGKETHPVVNVSWHDAQAYCRWLSEKIGKTVRLPTEAEWEKAAGWEEGNKETGRQVTGRQGNEGNRGTQGKKREYPWGDKWEELRCNTDELGLGDTSPVGLFLNGASPYGCLDMSGNVWEWCQSKYDPYPYQADDGREVINKGGDYRVLRGGSFQYEASLARVAFRALVPPVYCFDSYGFRVVAAPFSPNSGL